MARENGTQPPGFQGGNAPAVVSFSPFYVPPLFSVVSALRTSWAYTGKSGAATLQGGARLRMK